METKTTVETYYTLISKLEKSSKVYYTRFGDADFFIMNGRNTQDHKYSPELSRELIESFNIKDPDYLLGAAINHKNEPGMYRGVFQVFDYNDSMVNELFKNPKIVISQDDVFENAIMPHYLSVFRQELIIKFLDDYIRPKSKMYIGCVPEINAKKVVGEIDYHVTTPSKDAYSTIDSWWPKVLENIDNVDVCIPACGQAGRVVQKRLWNLDKKNHSIDIGSIVDVADGKNTRTWIKKEGNKVKNILI